MSSKFGVAQLAKAMGIEVATARGRLRAGKVKKNADGQYGWDSPTVLPILAAIVVPPVSPVVRYSGQAINL